MRLPHRHIISSKWSASHSWAPDIRAICTVNDVLQLLSHRHCSEQAEPNFFCDLDL